MADLTIVAAEIVYSINSPYIERVASVAVTAGQVVYLTATQEWALAQCDGTESEAAPAGIVIGSANAQQPCLVAPIGSIGLGATAGPTEGTIYVLSNTAGGIMPAADLITSTWYATILGVGSASNALLLTIIASGQQVP